MVSYEHVSPDTGHALLAELQEDHFASEDSRIWPTQVGSGELGSPQASLPDAAGALGLQAMSTAISTSAPTVTPVFTPV